MNISPRDNQINLLTSSFLTISDVPYAIQVFAENDIGESAGSNTITFTRTQSKYITVKDTVLPAKKVLDFSL